MAIAGTYPEQGVRVALDLRTVDATTAHYNGEAFTPNARYTLALAIDIASGKGSVEMKESTARDGGDAPPLDAPDVAFVKQLGTQLWRQATVTPPEQGGGVWARRVQRWRGPK
jgi:hypothetical protein